MQIHQENKEVFWDFPGGPVGKNPPWMGGVGSIFDGGIINKELLIRSSCQGVTKAARCQLLTCWVWSLSSTAGAGMPS